MKLQTGITSRLVYHAAGNTHTRCQRLECLMSCVGRIDKIDVGVPSDDRSAGITTKRMYTIHVTINGRKRRISAFQGDKSNTSVHPLVSNGDAVRFSKLGFSWVHDELNYSETSGGEVGALLSNCLRNDIPRRTTYNSVTRMRRRTNLCLFHSNV